MRAILTDLFDLVLPLHCAGCGAAGVGWCPGCASGFTGIPQRVRPRLNPGVPCWALGSYAGPRRTAVIAAKERGRRDLAGPLGVALARAVAGLHRDGELAVGPLVLVPAPTRRAAARVRGGDAIARFAAVAALELGCDMAKVLKVTGAAKDSVGLSAADRRRNLAGRIGCTRRGGVDSSAVVLVDDVLTTGATASESVRVLTVSGFSVAAVVTLTAA